MSFIHRKNPLRFCHVSPSVEGSTTSNLWTDNEIQRQEIFLEHMEQHLPNLTEDVLAQYAEEVLLFFWTHSAFFKVVYGKATRAAASFAEYGDSSRPIIQDDKANSVGFVCKTGTARGDDNIHEFVAVGRRQISGVPEDLAEEICPPVILALQIARDQYGISSRVNYAEIGLRAWVRAKPKVTLIALQ